MDAAEKVVFIIVAVVFCICIIILSAHDSGNKKRLDRIERHVGLDECECCKECE